MCGIAGIWHKNSVNGHDLENKIQAITNALAHRGPDGTGHLFFNDELEHDTGFGSSVDANKVRGCLGHRRLSIIDLSDGGHQPMVLEEGQLVITYNGELFNYLELKKALEKKGHQFVSASDTEVLLHAFMEWGENMYEKLEGMWAFAILNKRNKTLLLSRDRTGVKPLYYRYKEGVFSFASEIKGLLAFEKESPNNSALAKLLVHNDFNLKNETLFENIFELEAGRQIHFNTQSFDLNQSSFNNVNVNRDSYSSVGESDLLEKSEHFYSFLKETIVKHSRSDVPIASCLSGGLDSGTIVGILSELGHSNLQVFSSCFPDYHQNEYPYIKSLVEKHKLNWKISEPKSEGLYDTIEDLVYTQEYPLLSTSTYAQYELMKLVSKSGVKVVMDGQGADELLGGYNRYFNHLQQELLAQGRIKEAMNLPIELKRTGIELIKKSITKSGFTSLEDTVYKRSFFDFEAIESEWLEKNRWNSEGSFSANTLNERLFYDYFTGDLGTLLRAEDRNSMRFSIESRVPFADSYELAKWVFTLQSGYKLGTNGNKLLMRASAEKQDYLTKKILNRKDKLGYQTPSGQWIKEQKIKLFEYLNYIPDDIVNRTLLENKLNEIILKTNNDTDENLRLFKWFTLGAWFKVFHAST
ncbi:MAG: asparagine synthase (glutamine-hydrolyzing) [Crocinitomicaceae bacterium]|nr:asparagine synthase (glutamine-hydrolyzing) [Crocinitomicaceae bacterium]|tara:strand:- start:2265 stop:4181 length:1917 start_codon:yes stop_codon:yes gene_type:complete